MHLDCLARTRSDQFGGPGGAMDRSLESVNADLEDNTLLKGAYKYELSLLPSF